MHACQLKSWENQGLPQQISVYRCVKDRWKNFYWAYRQMRCSAVFSHALSIFIECVSACVRAQRIKRARSPATERARALSLFSLSLSVEGKKKEKEDRRRFAFLWLSLSLSLFLFSIERVSNGERERERAMKEGGSQWWLITDSVSLSLSLSLLSPVEHYILRQFQSGENPLCCRKRGLRSKLHIYSKRHHISVTLLRVFSTCIDERLTECKQRKLNTSWTASHKESQSMLNRPVRWSVRF